MVKAIIFDCFGVLATDSLKPFCEQYFSHDLASLAKAAELDKLSTAGKMTYAQFMNELAKLAGISVDEVDKALDNNPPNLELLNYIRDELKPRFKIGFLSNASDDWLDDLFTPEQQSLFDDVILSFQHGMAKPEAAIFALAAEQLGVETSECLFVDDVERYCDGARASGMQAVVFQGLVQLQSNLGKILPPVNPKEDYMLPPTLTMNNKLAIPQVGLGTWQMRDKDECKASVKMALKAGYTHFDTAQIYGNEAFIGEALQEAGAKRSDLFITTKVWNDNFRWEDLEPSVDESLQKLQTDYVDLLLLHFPVTETRRPAWRKMEELYKNGKARAVGVSNYTIPHLEELLRETDVPPVVNQVELHVFLQQPELLDFCKQHGIVVEAYSPLAHGTYMDNPVLVELAAKHAKTVAQIMLRWCVQQGLVVLPKSTHADRIKQNLELFDFELTTDDMAQIATLDKGLRTTWDPTHVQ